MGDMGDDFKWWHEQDKIRKERNLKKAQSNIEGWTIHTEYHWSRDLNGKRLNYWPSRNKFQYQGKVMVGDVHGFVRNRLKTINPGQ